MTADYLQNSAGSLNTIFQLYKAKIKDLPKKSGSDEVAEWWRKTCEDFDIAARSEDKDVENFSILFALACVEDLQCKYLNERCTNHHYINENMSLERFGEYLTRAEKGDYVTVNGVYMEVKRVDRL